MKSGKLTESTNGSVSNVLCEINGRAYDCSMTTLANSLIGYEIPEIRLSAETISIEDLRIFLGVLPLTNGLTALYLDIPMEDEIVTCIADGIGSSVSTLALNCDDIWSYEGVQALRNIKLLDIDVIDLTSLERFEG